MNTKSLQFTPSERIGKLSAIIDKPDYPEYLLVLAHGAGAGMQNSFMNKISEQLVDNNIAVFRYNFPYMEQGKNRPDPKPIITYVIRSAVETAIKNMPEIPVLAGGKSFGGRMTSTAESEKHIEGVIGIVFFGFPLHPPGKPSDERAEHLFNVKTPMLFQQGTRDSLADLKLLKPVCKKIGKYSDLQVIDGADHSFHVLKSSGTNDNQVIKTLARKVKEWADKIR